MIDTDQPEVASSLSHLESPEFQMLLDCARVSSAAALQNTLVTADWVRLLKEAEAHGLIPILYRQLNTAPWAPEGREKLANLQRIRVQLALRHVAVLLEIAQALKAENLLALPYKGPTLSARIFGDPFFREAVDLDFLVPADQVMAGVDLLGRMGFRRVRRYGAGLESALLKFRAEIGMERDGVLVELQWRLAPLYFSVPLDVRALAQRSGKVTISGVELPFMAPEDYLLILCIHGAKHHWQSLKWLVDIDRLIRTNGDLEWSRLQDEARRTGTLRILGVGLRLAVDLLGTPVPAQISRIWERDRESLRVADLCRARLACASPTEQPANHHLMVRMRERTRDRILYLFRLATQPTEREWDAVSLPHRLHSFYHCVRFGRVVAKLFHRGTPL